MDHILADDKGSADETVCGHAHILAHTNAWCPLLRCGGYGAKEIRDDAFRIAEATRAFGAEVTTASAFTMLRTTVAFATYEDAESSIRVDRIDRVAANQLREQLVERVVAVEEIESGDPSPIAKTAPDCPSTGRQPATYDSSDSAWCSKICSIAEVGDVASSRAD